MTIPLILLAIPSIFLGLFLGLPLGASRISGWLEPVFAEAVRPPGEPEEPFALFGIDGVLILASVAVATLGHRSSPGGSSASTSGRSGRRPARRRVSAIASANGVTRFLYRASLNKWWFDDLYDLLFIRIGGRVAGGLWWFDRNVIDGTVNGTGRVVSSARRRPAPGPDRPGPELRAGHRHRA